MPFNPNVMGYPFPPNTRAVSSFFLLLFLFAIYFLVSVTNPSIFKFQPTIQEHEKLVWLAGNLKLEVTNYSRDLYGPEGVAHLGGSDDDDDGGKEEDPEVTPSYQQRKRRRQ